VGGPGAPEAFGLIRADFEKLILALSDLGCPIAGAHGTGLPEITDDYIHFNGVRHCGHQKSMARWSSFQRRTLAVSIPTMASYSRSPFWDWSRSGAAMANAVTMTFGWANSTTVAFARLHSSPTMWRSPTPLELGSEAVEVMSLEEL